MGQQIKAKSTALPSKDDHNGVTVAGTVDRITYENVQTGFRIFVLTNQSTSVTAKGYVPALNAGQEVTLTGAWEVHPKFGKQFKASKCIASLPTGIVGLRKYLASGVVKGIGKIYAQKLVDAFGEKTLEVIDKTPQRLAMVDGIGPKRLKSIIEGWKEQKDVAHIMVFLQDKGITPAYAYKIYKKYGQEAVAIVQENPYRLAEDIWGIGFKIADQIAHSIGFDHHSIFRIKSGILYAIGQTIGLGHLYLDIPTLKEQTRTLLELTADDTPERIKKAFTDLHTNGKVKVIEHEGRHFVTLTQAYNCEFGVGQKITALLKYPSRLKTDIGIIYQRLRLQQGAIQLNEDQQRGIMTALQSKVTIITGGPGTGKTTLINQLLEIFDTLHVTYKLAAPTGRAAKRMNESTRRQASTIHRLLEFDPINMQFKHNEQNTLKLDILVVDEASMIDIFLANALLKAVPVHAHVVFIGDIDQLPPVGAGNFLRDLIASKQVSVIKLTEIFRQAQHSLIIVNAHRINNGTFPTSALPDAAKDFIWIKEELAERTTQHLNTIFKSYLARYGIPRHEAIVLSPMNRGVAGTQKLNRDLQELLNTGPGQKITYGLTEFKEGDRVMQIRNNYEKFVFNGDIGTIAAIDQTEQNVLIHYGERPITYRFSELDELVLAYAITVHKSQGSEYSAVIIPLFAQHFTLLARNLVYTAVTRAKKLCIIIGQPKALAIAIRNNKSVERKTFLTEFLTTHITCL